MKSTFSFCRRVIAATLPLIMSSMIANGQTTSFSTIIDFAPPYSSGNAPDSAVAFDKSGHLFGIAQGDGRYVDSVVYEATQGEDGRWTKRAIFSPTQTSLPRAPFAVDDSGNLYGGGGSDGNLGPFGVVYELSPESDGSWKRTPLHYFRDPLKAKYPDYGVILDKQGNLYGISGAGGQYSGPDKLGGTIFELSRQEDGKWSETILYSFDNPTGTYISSLTLDAAGNLYGVATNGLCGGVAFKLARPAADGASWTFSTLHTFPGYNKHGKSPTDASCLNTGIIVDADGNLFGTSQTGGPDNLGTVFEVPAGGGANGPDKILYTFRAADSGAFHPSGGLVLDGAGNLYGVTADGGQYAGNFGGGKIFELMPQKDSSWEIRALHVFGGRVSHGIPYADGVFPEAGLTIGPDGNLYGTTYFGGHFPGQTFDGGLGTVFRLEVH